MSAIIVSKGKTVAICFGQFGPYHRARAAALQTAASDLGIRVLPIQIADSTSTYLWTDARRPCEGLVTLCQGVDEHALSLEVFCRARRLFRSEKVDVAFLPSYWPQRFFALLLAAKSLGIRTVMMNESHAGTEYAARWKRLIKRQVMKRFDAALVGGEPQRRHFAALGVPVGKMFTGYDAVDNDFFSSRADEIRAAAKKSDELGKQAEYLNIREAYGLPERYFLSLGRMVEKKNLATLTAAYAKFCEESRVASGESGRQEPVALVFVGSGELEGMLREQARGLGLTVIDRTKWRAGESPENRDSFPATRDEKNLGTVYFYGFRQIEENPVFYALAEAFVLPSVKEEWGLVVNEAMAAGLPVIVSRTAGCAEDLVSKEPVTLRMETSSSILQTCVPFYRLPLFDLLAAELGPTFKVVSGERFFDQSIRTVAGGRHWYSPCRNRFLFGNNAVWQTGEAVKELSGSPLVAEGNPRCLRTWLILMVAKRRGIPAAVWGHARGRGSRRMSIIRRALFSLASHIVCYCYNEREYLTRLFPNKKIIVAGNSSVRVKDCAPLTEPAESRNAVLFMGRLVASKKPMLLLQAVEILQKNGHDIGAVFIGEGPERIVCERYADRAGLKGIRFAGEEFDVNKQRILVGNCFALASPGYIGLSALDALGFGLPVAYCPTEPNSPEVETLVDGENALGFTRDSASVLSGILYDFYKNRVAWLARGAEHCRTIREKYSIEHMAEEFAKFFREAAELAGKQSFEASLEERSNGFVFDPESVEALATALKRIADQTTKRLTDQETNGLTEMGKRSREIVGKFSCENFARQALRAAEAASA